MFCNYYLAKSCKEKTWFVVGFFRNEENLVFERTLDTDSSLLEFFVTPELEEQFLQAMTYLQQNGYILELKKLENRLKSDLN